VRFTICYADRYVGVADDNAVGALHTFGNPRLSTADAHQPKSVLLFT